MLRQAVGGERGDQSWRTGSSRQIVEGLSSDDDLRQFQTVELLCTELNMATPITLTMLNANSIVPLLLGCLRKSYNPELQLVTARALTYMSDSLTRTLDILSSGSNVEALLAPVSSLQDVELAEQCLSCLEKLCQTPAGAAATYSSNGITIMLSFVDFFTTGTQRKIWASIARMCKCVDCDSFSKVHDAIPLMRASVNSEDTKIRSKALSSLLRIICSVCTNPSMVNDVFNDLPSILIAIITRPDAEELSFAISLSLIQAAVSASDAAIRLVIESGLLTSLLNLLDGSASPMVSEDNLSMLPTVAAAAAEASSSLVSGRGGGGGGADSPSVKRRSLSYENTKTLCNIFTAMLVPNCDGPFGYAHELVELELKASLTAPAAPSNAGASGATDDEGEDDEDGSGEEEEEEENSDEEEEGGSHKVSLEELRERIRSTPAIHLRQTPDYIRLRNRNHICDRCNRTCALGNWFRCNECRDSDYCSACLLQEYASHGEGKHTFCDMKALFEAVPAKPKEHSEIEKIALALYRVRPDLLSEVLRAVPKVVVLCTQSDAAVIRASGMSFLLSAAAMASPELLQSSGMSGPDICEAIMVSIADGSLLLNLFGVKLAAYLLEKLPGEYATSLRREGVASALSQLQKRHAPNGNSSAASPVSAAAARAEDSSKPPLQTRVRSLEGWRGIVADEVAAVLTKFPTLNNNTRSAVLDKLVALLKANQMKEASAALKEALTARATAYEFAFQDVFHELKECLLRCDDNVEVILNCVVSLCESRDSSPSSSPRPQASSSSSSSSSLLAEFVRLLHTALAHLDQFAAPTFGSIRSIHSRIPLELLPHKPAPPHTTTAAKGASAAGPGKRKNRGTGDEEEEADSASAGGPSARVSIEPLASVGAVSEFISRNLLHQNTSPRPARGVRAFAADDGDGRVEEVLPELGQPSDGNRSKTKKSKTETAPGVWVRFENHIIPPSMTMVQLLQTLVAQKGKNGSGGQPHSPHRGPAAATGAAVPSCGADDAGITEPIRLYYSAKPFGAPYEMTKSFKEMPSDFRAAPRVVPPSKDTRPDAASRVLERLHHPFTYSRPYLTEAQMDILTILGVLYEITDNWAALLQHVRKASSLDEENAAFWSPSVVRADFVNRRLSNKAMRHCANLLLAGQHPYTWCVNLALDCNYLFTPSTRKFMFEVGFCGTVRSLARMQQSLAKYGVQDRSSVDFNPSRSIQLIREKKRVWRQHPLECVTELLGGARVSGSSSWEFEFYGEAGSGLGPTREFYTLVAKALCERSRKLWRSSGEADEEKYYTPLNGLYPRPLSAKVNAKELEEAAESFKVIGRFLSRALLDEHVASLPLSPVLLKLLRGEPCGIHDLRFISESLYTVLMAIMSAAKAKTSIVQLPNQKEGFPIESMSLQFTLPGDDSIELKPGGASVDVTSKNMVEYCDAVVNYMLNTGVNYAVTALREGFNDYIPLMALRMLSVEEFFETINGHSRPVTRQEFEDNCSADHGFTLTCNHVQWLFDILASFSLEEQKHFFLFLTGSPHLPVGGMPSLRPKLTIVRKTSTEAAVKEADQLPSAMTCQHYLKLPAYETKEQMEEKLRQAISDGADAFFLS